MNSGDFSLWWGGGIGGYLIAYEGQGVFCRGNVIYAGG